MTQKTNNSPPDAVPSFQPDPEAMVKMVQELPEAWLLACQQVMAGAPSSAAPNTWTTQWTLRETRVPGAPPEREFQRRSSVGPGEPPHQAFSRMQGEALDFWRRSLRSFARGLSMPVRDEQD